jgi:hypothetical protein
MGQTFANARMNTIKTTKTKFTYDAFPLELRVLDLLSQFGVFDELVIT